MQGYLINPEEKTIEVVEVSDDLDAIHKLIEAPLFDVVRLDHDDVIYVDDEGLYNKRSYFALDGHVTPLAGNGLVLGTDSEGYSTDPIHDLIAISNMVKFISYQEALEMAQLADAEGKRQEAELKKGGGIAYIYMPIAGILEAGRYTD